MHRQRRAGALAQPHSHIQQRRQPHGIQADPVPRLHRLVGGNKVIPGRRGDEPGNQGGGAGDKPVHHHRAPAGRRTQHRPGQYADFQPAHLDQHVQPVLRVRIVDLNGPPDYLDLMRQAGVVQAGAASGGNRRVGAGDDGSNGAGGGGVADAHIAAGNQVGALADLLLGGVNADFQAADGLLSGHRRADGHIGGAVGHLDRAQQGVRFQVGGHAGVENHNLRPGVPGQYVDAGPAAQKVIDHLRRDFLGVGADPFGHHAVVASGQNDRLAADLRDGVAEHPGQHNGQVFQPSQAAQGLGQGILPGLGSGHRFLIEGSNTLQGQVNQGGYGHYGPPV